MLQTLKHLIDGLFKAVHFRFLFSKIKGSIQGWFLVFFPLLLISSVLSPAF